MSGWVADENFRRKQSQIQAERWTEEYRNEISLKRRDPNSSYQSQEFKDKISSLVQGENNPNYGHKWTDEMKTALSNKKKSDPKNKNEYNPNAKKIVCVETGEIFNCIKYAKEKYKIRSDGSLTVALKHPTRTAAGLHWRYVV